MKVKQTRIKAGPHSGGGF